MESTKEQMFMMHNMLRNEISLLKINLDKFIEESERCQKLLNATAGGARGFTNIFGLIVSDRYMTQVVTILNMARKFNIQLEINSLDQHVINASSSNNGCWDDVNFTQTRLLKDFIEWRNSYMHNGVASLDGREIAPSAGRIKMTEHFPEINGDVLPANNNGRMVESLQLCESNCLLNDQKEQESESLYNNHKSKSINELMDLILPTKSLDIFQKGYEFHAYIVYVGDYKKREFFICQLDDYKILYELSSNLNFKPISRESLPTDDVFCVLEKKDTTVRDCLWRAVIVPNERTLGEYQKCAYLLDFGEVIPLTDQCQTFEAPPRYRDIPPLAIKCTLEAVEDYHLKCTIKDQEKCEQVLHKNEFEKVSFRVLHQDKRVLHLLILETPTKIANTLALTKNTPSNPFLYAEDLDDDANSSLNSAAAQLPRSLLKQVSPIKLPRLNICNKIGDKVQLVVTHIVNPISFYGIIQNDTYCCHDKTSSWHDHQIFPLQKQFSQPPQLNEIVLSQYAKDDYWYRARIIDINSEKDLYKVFYVDFGNTEDVPLARLAKCSKEQLKDPLRAILFRLANLSIVTMAEEFTFSMKTRLKSAIANMVVMFIDQIINVEIVDRVYNDLIVRLIDTQYADIPKMLVDMGVVKEI